MCLGILFACMSAYCQRRPEEDIGFPETGVIEGHEPYEVAKN